MKQSDLLILCPPLLLRLANPVRHRKRTRVQTEKKKKRKTLFKTFAYTNFTLKKHESTLKKVSFEWLDHRTTIDSGSNVATTIDPGDKNTSYGSLVLDH